MSKHLRFLALTLLLLGGCSSEKDASDIVLFVTPSNLTAKCGEKIYFDIQIRTINEYIATFTVDTFDAVHGTKRIYSTEPQSVTFTYRLVYTVPYFDTEDQRIQIDFATEDNLSNRQSRTIELEISNSTSLLPEHSGITLYSPHSGKPDGFSLNTLQPILCATSSPDQIDIYLEADPNDGKEILPTTWRTMTDVRFSKANNFDYPSASQASLTAVYNNSVKENYVKDLAIDDIILVGHLTEAWGVIKIVGKFDEEGAETDRYLINVKNITSADTSDDTIEDDTTETDESAAALRMPVYGGLPL